MVPWCLQPHGRFCSPPRYTFHDPNAPPLYGDLFPLGYTTFCLWYCHQNPIPMYKPLQAFILDLPPAYSLVDPHVLSESEDR